MFSIHIGHQRRIGWKDILAEDEQCLLRFNLDPSTYHKRKLPNCEIVWDQVFLLVDVRSIASVRFLYNNLENN